MSRFLFTVALIMTASSASALNEQDSCARDVARFCRAVMNNGDSAVLACLKQNRVRLSKVCVKVLAEHGH